MIWLMNSGWYGNQPTCCSSFTEEQMNWGGQPGNPNYVLGIGFHVRSCHHHESILKERYLYRKKPRRSGAFFHKKSRLSESFLNRFLFLFWPEPHSLVDHIVHHFYRLVKVYVFLKTLDPLFEAAPVWSYHFPSGSLLGKRCYIDLAFNLIRLSSCFLCYG